MAIVRSSPVAIPVSAALKRAMGKKTPSQSRKNGQGERVYSLNKPAKFIIPKLDNTPYRTVQSLVFASPPISSSSGATYYAYNFQVGNLDQIASFTALFDQYRIRLVEVMFVPRVTVNNATSSNFGLFSSVVDYDDSNALTSVAQAYDYQNCLTSSGLDGHYRKFIPHIAEAAYAGSFTSYANKSAPWIDAASANVQHYGVKTAWTQTDAAYTMDMVVHLHIEWRNLR